MELKLLLAQKLLLALISLTIEPRRQSVTCLATDACLTVDTGFPSSIPARSQTFVEINHDIISIWSFPSLPLKHSKEAALSNKRNYAHEVMVNRFFKLAQEMCG